MPHNPLSDAIRQSAMGAWADPFLKYTDKYFLDKPVRGRKVEKSCQKIYPENK